MAPKVSSFIVLVVLGCLNWPPLYAAEKSGISPRGASIVDLRKASEEWDDVLRNAIQKGEKSIYFPPGIYPFVKGVVLKADGLTLYGEGTIVPKNALRWLFSVRGDNNKFSLNIDGKDLLANGISLKGNNLAVVNSKIANLRGKENDSAIAIFIESNGKFEVANNDIKDLYAEGDGITNNGAGMSRAIAISRTSKSSPKKSFIRNNVISNVFGEEGDGITMISLIGDHKYGSINVDVEKNTIKNFSRRAIKSQGSDVRIISNVIRNEYDKGVEYNCSSAISIYVAKNTVVKNNQLIIDKCNSLTIYMGKSHPNVKDVGNVQIIDNQFEIAASIDSALVNISVPTRMEHLEIKNNRAVGNTKGFFVSNSDGAEISGNQIVLRSESDKSRYIRTSAGTSQQQLAKTNCLDIDKFEDECNKAPKD